MTRTGHDETQVAYGRIAVPVAWAAAVGAVAVTALVLVDKGSRPWGEHGPVMLEGEGDPGPYIFFGTLTALFLIIATRLWRRDPANSLARWAAVFSFAVSSAVVTDMLGSWLLTFRGVSDGALILRLLVSVWLGVGWSAMVVMLLRFPTGRGLGRRWRVVEMVGLAGAALLGLAVFDPGNQDIAPYTNPFVDSPLSGIADLGYFGWTFLSFGTLLAIVSILLRAFRARGDERQQLKWVGFGFVFGWGGAFLITVMTGDGGGDGLLADSELAVSVGDALIPFFIFAMPAALLVAMFRYRLWDIDRIIRRTAIYTVVIGVLVGVYATIVLALGLGVFGVSQDGVVGSGAGPIPVALATLVAAALFRPLQRRVKDVVDRRFNRKRYDAEQTIAAFLEQLRDEIDVHRLAEGLAEATASTMQPDHVAVWLAPEGGRA